MNVQIHQDGHTLYAFSHYANSLPMLICKENWGASSNHTWLFIVLLYCIRWGLNIEYWSSCWQCAIHIYTYKHILVYIRLYIYSSHKEEGITCKMWCERSLNENQFSTGIPYFRISHPVTLDWITKPPNLITPTLPYPNALFPPIVDTDLFGFGLYPMSLSEECNQKHV